MKSKSQKKAEALQLETQQLTQQNLKEDLARRNQIFQQIAPLANMLMQFGINPLTFLQSPQGAALLAPVRQEIGSAFDQARTNLVDIGAGAGFSPGSGMMAGPLANTFTAEAGAQAGALQNLIAQALGLGLQGGNLLQGQQAVFNPAITGGLSLNAGQSILSQQPSGIIPALIQAGGQALGGFLGGQAGGGMTASGAGQLSNQLYNLPLSQRGFPLSGGGY